MEKMISARTIDFQPSDEDDREGGEPDESKVRDNQKVIIGGMITEKNVKYTKTNKVMAFLTVEDLVGTVEVMVFPRDYEKWQNMINEDARVFIQGRVSAEDDKASKLILERYGHSPIFRENSGSSLKVRMITARKKKGFWRIYGILRVQTLSLFI